jgi:hypothetical protein
MSRYAFMLGIALMLPSGQALAQEAPPPPNAAEPALPPPPEVRPPAPARPARAGQPEQPDIPKRVESGQSLDSSESLEPQVTLIRKRGATIEEYRVGGQVYLVRVKPVWGRPYYIRHPDSEGRTQRCTSDIYCDFAVPQWVLFSW